jgi:hypothetical protein
MSQKKKRWHRPELIVLVRSNPEEMVLINCKTISYPSAGGGKCKASGTACTATSAVGGT